MSTIRQVSEPRHAPDGTAPDGTAYDLTGPVDAPVVVLIHGLGLARGIWDDHMAAFAGYRVLRYDLYGHGDSAPPPATASLSVYAAQIAGLLDTIGVARAHIVGFSIGGMINRRFAMDYPTRTASLIVLNSPHERSPEQQKLVEERARDTSASGPAANLDVTLERWFTAEFRRDYPEKVQQVRDVVLANEPKNYAAHREVLATGVLELIRPKPPLAIPTLVMTCENDTGSTPAMSHTIASEIPHSQTIIVPDLQHLGLLEKLSESLEHLTDKQLTDRLKQWLHYFSMHSETIKSVFDTVKRERSREAFFSKIKQASESGL